MIRLQASSIYDPLFIVSANIGACRPSIRRSQQPRGHSRTSFAALPEAANHQRWRHRHRYRPRQRLAFPQPTLAGFVQDTISALIWLQDQSRRLLLPPTVNSNAGALFIQKAAALNQLNSSSTTRVTDNAQRPNCPWYADLNGTTYNGFRPIKTAEHAVSVSGDT